MNTIDSVRRECIRIGDSFEHHLAHTQKAERSDVAKLQIRADALESHPDGKPKDQAAIDEIAKALEPMSKAADARYAARPKR